MTDTHNQTLIYTDGACTKNGKVGARAGVGIYFGENDDRNISMALPGVDQTNQRAELYAVMLALEYCVDHSNNSFIIYSDSMYCVKGYNEWIVGWLRNNWKNSKGNPVANQDLWKRVAQLRVLSLNVKLEWIKGHSKNPGNEAADALAVAAIIKKLK